MDFKTINPAEIDWTGSLAAKKTARVQAEFVEAGTQVSTVMKDGHVETNNVAPEGGAMKVTNPSGEQYLVGPDKFAKRYAITEAGDYAPIAEPVQIIRTEENVSFMAPWGEEMRIKAGGALVNAGPGDVYGIQPEEFEETYSILGAWPLELDDPFTAEPRQEAEANTEPK